MRLAGKVFDTGVAAGANEGSGLSFGLKDERPYRHQALDLAIKAARAEAEAVCRAMGVTLKGPHTIQVIQGGGPVQLQSERLLMKSTTPVLPGEPARGAPAKRRLTMHRSIEGGCRRPSGEEPPAGDRRV